MFQRCLVRPGGVWLLVGAVPVHTPAAHWVKSAPALIPRPPLCTVPDNCGQLQWYLIALCLQSLFIWKAFFCWLARTLILPSSSFSVTRAFLWTSSSTTRHLASCTSAPLSQPPTAWASLLHDHESRPVPPWEPPSPAKLLCLINKFTFQVTTCLASLLGPPVQNYNCCSYQK